MSPHDRFSRIDRAFDTLIRAELRQLSGVHWTPVHIAIRAIALLCPARTTRVLDVGGGVGKLCSIGALSGYGIWTGVEQSAALVEAARDLAKTLGVTDRTAFVHGDALAIDWSDYDALYLYNPFEVGDTGSATQIHEVQYRLASLRDGVRVVTLHGFGGTMPSTYQLEYHERIAETDVDLALWVQHAQGNLDLS